MPMKRDPSCPPGAWIDPPPAYGSTAQVGKDDACPHCGEQDAGSLEIQPDGITRHCRACGHQYQIDKREGTTST